MKTLVLSKAGLWVVLLVMSARCIEIFLTEPSVAILGWLVFGGWIVWILYAFEHNKDMPGVGPFSYKAGRNQIARALFAVSMATIFIIAAIFG